MTGRTTHFALHARGRLAAADSGRSSSANPTTFPVGHTDVDSAVKQRTPVERLQSVRWRGGERKQSSPKLLLSEYLPDSAQDRAATAFVDRSDMDIQRAVDAVNGDFANDSSAVSDDTVSSGEAIAKIATAASHGSVASRSSLSLLSGVRPGEAESHRPTNGEPEDRDGAVHHRMRFRLKPLHVVMALLMLLIALCASLTLLLQQALNYAQYSSQTPGAAVTSPPRMETSTESDVAGKAREPSGSSNGSTPADAGTSENTEASGSQKTQVPEPSEPADTRIDINTASLQDLDQIYGVGPVTAQRIIDYRASIGRFSSVDQLLDIDGIGPKTLEKLRPLVKVS